MISRVRYLVPIFVLLCAFPAQSQIPVPGPGSLGHLGIWYVRDPAPSLMGQTGASAGAFVDRVIKGSPAAEIGLETGDVIVEIGGNAVASAEDADNLFRLRKLKPGDTVGLKCLRKGRPLEATVTVSRPLSIFPRMRVPFVARMIEERKWTQNGLLGSITTETKLYRDSAGRMAEETFRPAGAGTLHTVSIFDSVNLVRTSIDHRTKRARIVRHQRKLPAGFKFKKNESIRYIRAQPSQYLGTKMIEGLSCEGYRIQGVAEMPSFIDFGSGQPLRFSTETWGSDLTVYPIMEIEESPIKGHRVRKLVDIQEGVEPELEIFEIPEGYDVEEVELADIMLQRLQQQQQLQQP